MAVMEMEDACYNAIRSRGISNRLTHLFIVSVPYLDSAVEEHHCAVGGVDKQLAPSGHRQRSVGADVEVVRVDRTRRVLVNALKPKK